MIIALSSITAEQNNGMASRAQAVAMLLYYTATNPDAKIRFRCSNMILHIHSNASYFSEKKAQSRVAGHFYLREEKVDKINGPVLVLAKILNCVMASAAEAECSGLYENGREAIPLQMALEEMGHQQPATPMATDNSTVEGIMNANVQQKRSKEIDMRFYWMQDCIWQGQFYVYWKSGTKKLANYPSKHHLPAYHRKIWSTYIHGVHTIFLQGCVESCVAGQEAVTQKLASARDNMRRGTETRVCKSICFPPNYRWCTDTTCQQWNPGKP
eukprot:7113153-Ditylum_brightwellii.AAC.1